jgi:hypothetical protein
MVIRRAVLSDGQNLARGDEGEEREKRGDFLDF